MKTVWSIFRDFVNSREIGTIILRQELLEQIESDFISQGSCTTVMGEKVALFSEATLDNQRNMAEKAGYLSKTLQSGIYKVVKHFDPDYTVSQLRKDYDERYCKNKADKQ